MIVSFDNYTIENNKLVKDGSSQIQDIGKMDHIVINGINYELERKVIQEAVGDEAAVVEYIVN